MLSSHFISFRVYECVYHLFVFWQSLFSWPSNKMFEFEFEYLIVLSGDGWHSAADDRRDLCVTHYPTPTGLKCLQQGVSTSMLALWALMCLYCDFKCRTAHKMFSSLCQVHYGDLMLFSRPFVNEAKFNTQLKTVQRIMSWNSLYHKDGFSGENNKIPPELLLLS